jgi:SOS response regulatory protein OraA/RecX
MKKNEIIIKEAIEDLLKIRQKRYDELMDAMIIQEWSLGALDNEENLSGYSEITEGVKVAHSFGVKKNNIEDICGEKKKDEKDIWNEFVADFDPPLIKLNNLLDRENQNDEVLQIEKNMAKLHGKKYLSVKEFAEKYNVSKSSQTQYRSRLRDPLPYHQKVQGGNITYLVEEVERWLENQDK